MANTWIKKGVKNVRVVYGGSIEMKKAGFPFIKPARIRKNVRQNNFFFNKSILISLFNRGFVFSDIAPGS